MNKWFVTLGVVGFLLVAAGALAVQQYGAAQTLSDQPGAIRQAPVQTAAGGCGGGCCGSGGAALQTSALEKELYRVYSEKLGDPDIQVRVTDYGCHQEAEILKGEVVLKRLSISGGSVTELQG